MQEVSPPHCFPSTWMNSRESHRVLEPLGPAPEFTHSRKSREARKQPERLNCAFLSQQMASSPRISMSFRIPRRLQIVPGTDRGLAEPRSGHLLPKGPKSKNAELLDRVRSILDRRELTIRELSRQSEKVFGRSSHS